MNRYQKRELEIIEQIEIQGRGKKYTEENWKAERGVRKRGIWRIQNANIRMRKCKTE